MHNEQAVVATCVKRVIVVLKTLKLKTKLIVVDDGSVDKTPSLLKQLRKKYSKVLAVVTHPKNKGYGAGLQSGIREGLKQKFEFAVFMDSDLTNDPAFLTTFATFVDKPIDCVKASRYVEGGKMVGVPFQRQLFSRAGNLFASIMFGIGINDCTNGFRMVRLSKLRGVTFKERNFPIILEELYELKKKGARFAEMPHVLTNRKRGKTHFAYNLETIFAYAKYAIKAAFISVEMV